MNNQQYKYDYKKDLSARTAYVWEHFFTEKGVGLIRFDYDLEQLSLDPDLQTFLDAWENVSYRMRKAVIGSNLRESILKQRLQEQLNPSTNDRHVLTVIRRYLWYSFPEKVLKSGYRDSKWVWEFSEPKKENMLSKVSIYYNVANSLCYTKHPQKSLAELVKHDISFTNYGWSAADLIHSVMEACKPDFKTIREWLEIRLDER